MSSSAKGFFESLVGRQTRHPHATIIRPTTRTCCKQLLMMLAGMFAMGQSFMLKSPLHAVLDGSVAVSARLAPGGIRVVMSTSCPDRRGLLEGWASVFLAVGLPHVAQPTQRAHAVKDDEYDVAFDAKQPLGLALEDFGQNGKYRTYVSKTLRGSQATSKGIRIPALVVAVNGRNVEGLPRKMVVQLIRDAQEGRNGMGEGSSLMVTFRDPAKFMELLSEKSTPGGGEGAEISTQLAPQTQAREAQTLTVKKTYVPEICQTGAKYGDLLEIKYATRLEDGTFLDATGVSTPGRGGDSTLYFVLGEQVAGTVPKGWDLALVGACVGEKRRIKTPSVLAFGTKGLKRKGIPPDATIVYDVEVIGINGNNIPR